MRIAVDVSPLLGSNLSGVGYYGHYMINELSRIEHNAVELQFFSLRNTDKKIREIEKSCGSGAAKVNCCGYFTMRWYMLLTAVVPLPRRFFFKGKPDITFFFNYYLPPLAGGKKAVVIHDMTMKDHPDTVSRKNRLLFRTFLDRSIRRADKIVTVSQFSKERIAHYYPNTKDRIAVIPNAVDHERFRPLSDRAVIESAKEKYGISGEYILFLGNIEPRKNLERLIEAYSVINNEEEKVPDLVIAGGMGWLYDGIIQRAKGFGLENKIVFPGYIDEDDVAAIICGAEFLCFPSLYEGFGMPVLEAMACGTPVLTSDCSSLPEVGGDCCLYVDPSDVRSIAQGIRRLMKDEGLRHSLSVRGIARAGQFTWERSARMLNDVFQKMIWENFQ